MDQYIPLNKRNKKEQKEFYLRNRRSWNGVHHATRTIPDGKTYNRNKLRGIKTDQIEDKLF